MFMGMRILYIIAAVIFIAGIGLLTKGFLNSKDVAGNNKNMTKPLDPNVQKALEDTRASDYERLTSDDADLDEAQIIKSLKRYTGQNLEDSEGIIVKYLESNSPKVRAAALESAGAYEWADPAWYSKALNSKDKNLRMAAIAGLRKRINPPRISILQKHVSMPELSNDEKIAGYIALIKLHNDKNDQYKYLDQLISGRATWTDSDKIFAYKEIFRAFPRDEKVKTMAALWLEDEESPEVQGLIRNYVK